MRVGEGGEERECLRRKGSINTASAASLLIFELIKPFGEIKLNKAPIIEKKRTLSQYKQIPSKLISKRDPLIRNIVVEDVSLTSVEKFLITTRGNIL